MKRNKLLLSILAILMAFSVVSFLACSETEPLPNVVQGKDTVVENIKTAPAETDAKTAVFAALGKLYGADTFVTETKGETVASKGFIEYVQDITATSIKHGDEYYSQSISTSSLVNVKHEAFVKGDLLAYRIDDGEIVNTSVASYKEIYGVTPDKLLTGHVLNQDTILYAKLTEQKDGLYVYTLALDKEKANSLLQYQMKMFGGLNGYPQFTVETEMQLTVKQDFTPVSLSYVSVYNISVPVIGSLQCTENCEVTVSKVGEEVAIPDTDKFNEALGSEPSIIEPRPDVKVDENLEAVIGSVLALDIKNGISLTGSIVVGDYYVPLKISAKADVDDIINNGGDIGASIDVMAQARINGKELAVIYSDKKLYANVFGKKYGLDLKDIGVASGGFAEIEIEDIISVKKDAKKSNVYNVSLSNDVVKELKQFIVAKELISETDKFEIKTDFYVANGVLGSVSSSIIVGSNTVTATFAVANEALELPSDLNEYALTGINEKALAVYAASNLMGIDFGYGVSLTGKVMVGNVFLPVKVAAKADIDSLINMEKTALEAIECALTVNIGTQEAVVVYSDRNFYVNAFGLKYKFVSDVKDIEIGDLSTEGMFDISYQNNTLSITLTEEYTEIVSQMLQMAGVLGEEESCFVGATVYAPMYRPSFIVAQVKGEETLAEIEFAVANEKFELPSDLGTYKTDIRFGANVKIQLNQDPDSEEFVLGVDAQIAVTYDTNVTNPAKALKVEVAITLDENIKSMLGLAGMFGMELPDWIGVASGADTLNIVFENGELYFMAVNYVTETVADGVDAEGNQITKEVQVSRPVFVSKLELPQVDFGEIGDTEIDPSEIMSLLGALFTVNIANDTVEIKLVDDITSLLNMFLSPMLNELIFKNVGPMGVMVMPITGLYRPISYIGMQISLTDGNAALIIRGYDVEMDEVVIEGKEYGETEILRITFSGADMSDYKYIHNAAKAFKDDVEAAKVREAIEEFEHFFPATEQEFNAKIAEVKAMYEALTDSQKALVYNYEKGSWTKESFDEYYAELYNTDKKAADKWVEDYKADKDIAGLITRYFGFTDLQREYLDIAYAETMSAFVLKASESQAETVKAWNETAKAIVAPSEDELLAMTMEEAIAYMQKVLALKSQQNKFVAAVDADALAVVELELARASEVVAIKLAEQAEEYTRTLLSMQYGCYMCVQEMIDLYNEIYALYDEVYGDLSDEAKAYIAIYNPQIEGTIALNSYYLTAGVGFRQGASMVATAEIAKILNSSATDGLEERIAKLDELIELADVRAISNYEAYLQFKETLNKAAA